MRIEVDMSGKIEQTNVDTVVAFRNSEQYSVLFKKKTKAEILTEYRNKYKDTHYRLFAILIYYCIRNYLNKKYSRQLSESETRDLEKVFSAASQDGLGEDVRKLAEICSEE